MKEKFNCENCGKKDCESCVKDGGKTFCCEHCCDDYKKKQQKPAVHESANVCKFC